MKVPRKKGEGSRHNFPQAAYDRDADGGGEGLGIDRRKPDDGGDLDIRRVDPHLGNECRRHRDEDDAQILHESDEALVGAEGTRHQHHGGGRTRRRAPDGGGAGQDAPAADQPAEQAGGCDGRHHDAKKQRPFLVEDRKDVGRDRRRDEAADDRLGGAEQKTRHAHRGAIGAGDDGGQHRPDQQRRRQGGEFQRAGKQQGNNQQGKPLPELAHPRHALECGQVRGGLLGRGIHVSLLDPQGEKCEPRFTEK